MFSIKILHYVVSTDTGYGLTGHASQVSYWLSPGTLILPKQATYGLWWSLLGSGK